MRYARVTITDHAYARSKERLGWTKKTTKRMCEKAFFEGLSMDDLHGSIHNYLKERLNVEKNLIWILGFMVRRFTFSH